MRLFLSKLLRFFLVLPFGWLLLFCAAIVSPDVESHFIAKEKNWGFVNAKTSEWADIRDSLNMDVVVFGSSTCYSGVDPQAFKSSGIEAFNFCSSAQAIPHSVSLIKALTEDQVPQILVLDVYPKAWGNENISSEPVLDWIVNGNLWDIHWTTAYVHLTAVSHSPFAAMTLLYFPLRRLISPAGERAAKDSMGEYSGRGFVFRTFPPLDNIPSEEPIAVNMSNAECEAFASLVGLCRKKGIELLLLNPPQLIEEEFAKPDCMEGHVWIEGNDWPGAKSPHLYYDDHHLVGKGAQQYSQWLVTQVKARAKSLR